ncbi:5-methylcytosine-specific restriction endonuclease system specificity protein McrC [Methyloceanibacter sp.]|uniref:5-methylcytosine-specific restriction endonuclease system specificity protein McrC n=1 Tax=Methyloceanibacter sp. TaxID=1965321 RepID=UPI003D6CF65E
MTRTSIGIGYVGRIPVRNLWLLMLYASDLFRTRKSGRVGLEDSVDELPDLVAEILADAVEKRQRRNLSMSYQSSEGILGRVRGRIDVLKTECNHLLLRGRVACRFETLTIDTPRNRFVRAALEAISRVVQRSELAHYCRKLANDMKSLGVSGNPPTRMQLSKDRFGRHDADDRIMVAAAKLAFDLTLPNEAVGSNFLPLPDKEERWVRHLYERAVGGFYEVVLNPKKWQVTCGKRLAWQIEKKTSQIDKVLPMMRTDVILEDAHACRRIVIDTKFNTVLTKGWYREESLRSGYLYQMYSYLRSQAGLDVLADRAQGLFLHPTVEQKVDETAVIQGHAIRFATVDLTGTASEIRFELLRVCDPWLPEE